MSLSGPETQTYNNKVSEVDAGFQQYHIKLLLILADAFIFKVQIKQKSFSQQQLL